MCEAIPDKPGLVEADPTLVDHLKNLAMKPVVFMHQFIEISLGCSCGGASCRRCIGTFIGSVAIPAVAGVFHVSRNQE